MVKTYSFLLIAIFCEVAGTMLLPVSQNFTKLFQQFVLHYFIYVSFYLLTFVWINFQLQLYMQHGVDLEFLQLQFLDISFLNKL